MPASLDTVWTVYAANLKQILTGSGTSTPIGPSLLFSPSGFATLFPLGADKSVAVADSNQMFWADVDQQALTTAAFGGATTGFYDNYSSFITDLYNKLYQSLSADQKTAIQTAQTSFSTASTAYQNCVKLISPFDTTNQDYRTWAIMQGLDPTVPQNFTQWIATAHPDLAIAQTNLNQAQLDLNAAYAKAYPGNTQVIGNSYTHLTNASNSNVLNNDNMATSQMGLKPKYFSLSFNSQVQSLLQLPQQSFTASNKDSSDQSSELGWSTKASVTLPLFGDFFNIGASTDTSGSNKTTNKNVDAWSIDFKASLVRVPVTPGGWFDNTCLQIGKQNSFPFPLQANVDSMVLASNIQLTLTVTDSSFASQVNTLNSQNNLSLKIGPFSLGGGSANITKNNSSITSSDSTVTMIINIPSTQVVVLGYLYQLL